MTSLARFVVYLALSSSVLGAAIPATVTTTSTAAATSTHSTEPYYKEATGALWKNNVHDKVHLPATTAITEVLRRSGELWKGREHEEVDLVTGLSRRSGELWRGLEHEEVSALPNL
ncbi:uncharacterized protein BJ212DRAFT_1484998 [Suillus subaureus]|uniref:Uncharacterized protein n=1 Tax=Suillus subaureus TaxID=48587 RepID=A0A9P7E159_9AGAM|nr:uncharacterized protein BJ212DRAFT_1484998 [Suillus subaureus]KAG1808369.1 hypothetical protein BJ212DRAFT_1484998 [Suillus subaureus]